MIDLGTDDLFKKRKQARKERKFEYKQPKANSFLIVTEGQQTEPLYFSGLANTVKEKLGGKVDVVEIPIINIHGAGCATTSLVNKTTELVSKSNVIYQNIWIVFDKDDFIDFDSAISLAVSQGYSVAWSNQSFEYWLYLHFNFSDSSLHRDEWIKKLDAIFRDMNLGDRRYQKNYKNIYSLVDTYNGVDTAISNAKRIMARYNLDIDKPSTCDPGTTVYVLVEALKKYLDEVSL